MFKNSKMAKVALAAVPSLFLLGCATQEEASSLKNDMTSLKADMQRALQGIDQLRAAQTQQGQRLDQLNTAVQRAQSTADAAAADARRANEQAGRAFRGSLRK